MDTGKYTFVLTLYFLILDVCQSTYCDLSVQAPTLWAQLAALRSVTLVYHSTLFQVTLSTLLTFIVWIVIVSTVEGSHKFYMISYPL